jgi:hypothetical protein
MISIVVFSWVVLFIEILFYFYFNAANKIKIYAQITYCDQIKVYVNPSVLTFNGIMTNLSKQASNKVLKPHNYLILESFKKPSYDLWRVCRKVR